MVDFSGATNCTLVDKKIINIIKCASRELNLVNTVGGYYDTTTPYALVPIKCRVFFYLFIMITLRMFLIEMFFFFFFFLETTLDFLKQAQRFYFMKKIRKLEIEVV